jgi:phosphate transport system substrate-binding protein
LSRDGATSRRALLLSTAAIALGGCAGESAPTVVRGAGATLPYPLYARWIARYRGVEPRVRVDYRAVGSAAGIRQLLAGMAEFGATDAPFRASPFPLLHVPTTASAVALAYGPLGLPRPLRLGPRALAAIFGGAAARWSHPAIGADNPGLSLPDWPLVAVHRSDGSGATQLFTEHLARACPGLGIEPGMLARFPAGVGARGSDGVAGVVARVRGSIGYVEIVHARAAGLALAAIASGDGDPGVAPTEDSVRAAASGLGVGGEPSGHRPSSSYPLTGLSFLVAPASSAHPQRAAALARFAFWILGPGQRDCEELGYLPLPQALVGRARSLVAEGLSSSAGRALRID